MASPHHARHDGLWTALDLALLMLAMIGAGLVAFGLVWGWLWQVAGGGDRSGYLVSVVGAAALAVGGLGSWLAGRRHD